MKVLASLVPRTDNDKIDWTALLAYWPVLKTLAATNQDKIFHAEGNVWTHTQMVIHELVKQQDYQEASADRQFIMFYAALLHDIAKPTCTVVDEAGRIGSPGHAKRGSVDARILLWRADVPFPLRENICALITAHQQPFFVMAGKISHPEFVTIKLAEQLSIRELAALAQADNAGRIAIDQSKTQDNIDLFRLVAQDMGCYDSPYVFPDDHTKLSYFRSNATISPDYPFYQPAGSKVTVLSGLPASGKDTWIQKNAPGLPVISFDDAREELGLAHGARGVGAAVHLATDRAKALLREHLPFVWNATHLSAQMRKKTLDLLCAYQAEVTIVYLEHPESVILGRNHQRDSTLSNKGIVDMLFKWEVPQAYEAHQVNYLINGELSLIVQPSSCLSVGERCP